MSNTTLPLSQIETSGLQVRVATDRSHIDDLVELFGDDGEWPPTLPPLVVFGAGAGPYFLADGHHRYQAAQEVGCTEVPVEVHDGGRDHALAYAVGANATHGLRRTNADKRNAVRIAFLADSRCSARALAELCCVSVDLACDVVNKIKNERVSESVCKETTDELTRLGAVCKEKTDGDTRLGAVCKEKTDGDTRLGAVCKETTDEPAPDIRVCKDGRIRDVSRIGKKKAAPAPDKPVAVDGVGWPLTAAISPAFVTALEIDNIVKILRNVQLHVREIATARGCELIQSRLRCEIKDGVERWRSNDVQNAIAELQHGRPYAVCPQCRETVDAACTLCEGLGWITESTWQRTPERLKAAPAA